MHSIAQMYGIQIKSLDKMNKKDKDYIPEEGSSAIWRRLMLVIEGRIEGDLGVT